MPHIAFNMQQIMPVIVTIVVMLFLIAVYTLWNLNKLNKRRRGKVIVKFNTMERTYYRCLCDKDGDDCIIPPMGKDYEKLTGKQRTADLPPVYFLHSSKGMLTEYPETGIAMSKAMMPAYEFNEWNAEPVDPYDQDYVVSAELVAAKTRREVAKYLVYSSRDQLKIVEEVEKLMKMTKGVLNPTYIYIGLGLAILAAGYGAYQVMQLSKTIAGG